MTTDAADATAPNPAGPGPSLLVDLRPCYEGYAGIPQEVRLLFAMFAGMDLKQLGGLASGIHFTSRHLRPKNEFERVLAQTQVLIAQDSKRINWGMLRMLPRRIREPLFRSYLAASEVFRRERLDLEIDAAVFEDFLWVKLFDRTLSPQQRALLMQPRYIATELGHEYARSFSFLPRLFQRHLDSQAWNVFFGATVSPYKPAPGTAMMIRYYDALPLLSPHTIGEAWPHANSHARMLRRNIDDGAFFYCDSEPVRSDLISLFPHAEKRIHTIPVVLAPDYRPDVRPARELATILKRRASPLTAGDARRSPAAAEQNGADQQGRGNSGPRLPRLIMAVSTLEPRKNYLKLFHAFEIAKRITAEPLQLLIVANPGWRSETELTELKLLVREGAYHLSGVPLAELRVLYSMAHCVVAPSRAEGFDYSGIEAMACGTPVIASDIAVHRWVYGDAAIYFDPYDEEDLAQILARVADLQRDEGHLAEMRDRGLSQAALYSPDALAPRWDEAIRQAAWLS